MCPCVSLALSVQLDLKPEDKLFCGFVECILVNGCVGLVDTQMSCFIILSKINQLLPSILIPTIL